MLNFLQTIGLLAAAGIILPVIIHLWNKKEGKTLKIGSVQLLVETARQQARSLRLKDLWLLLLRCGIILSLALHLAEPVWQKQLAVRDRKGWLVLEQPENEVYKKEKDSLLQTGFEPHLFAPGFPIIQPGDTAALGPVIKKASSWALLKALNEQVPADLPIYLITSNRLASFNGNRPAVSMNLHWLTFSDADTATGNSITARLLSNDSIEATVSHSTTTYTAYENRNIKAELSINNDTAIPSYLPIDTSTLRIAIIKEAAPDAAYLEAAIAAIRQFGAYRIQVETITNPAGITGRYDWLFWLSQKELPTGLNARNIFRYEKGKEMTALSGIETTPGSSLTIPLQKKLESTTSLTAEVVWRNGFGEPVLTQEKGATNLYRFYSRFDPAWNGLVWSETFPQVLFRLMIKDTGVINPGDHRTIVQQQMLPEQGREEMAAIKPGFIITTSLSQWAWAIAFLLFVLERFVVFQIKRESHG